MFIEIFTKLKEKNLTLNIEYLKSEKSFLLIATDSNNIEAKCLISDTIFNDLSIMDDIVFRVTDDMLNKFEDISSNNIIKGNFNEKLTKG